MVKVVEAVEVVEVETVEVVTVEVVEMESGAVVVRSHVRTIHAHAHIAVSV